MGLSCTAEAWTLAVPCVCPQEASVTGQRALLEGLASSLGKATVGVTVLWLQAGLHLETSTPSSQALGNVPLVSGCILVRVSQDVLVAPPRRGLCLWALGKNL